MDKENLRHKFSALLMHTDENNPLSCNVLLDDEAFGLSTLQIPKCVGVFQESKEGIIWFIMEDCKEPIEFDDISFGDLINIYNTLSGNI